MLEVSKNNPKNKLSDFETTIYQGSRKKNPKEKSNKTKMFKAIKHKFRKISLRQSEI